MQISVLKDAIFRVVAAILHLGNVEFAEGSEADSSVPKDEKSQFHLRTAAELFMYMNYYSFCLVIKPIFFTSVIWRNSGILQVR